MLKRSEFNLGAAIFPSSSAGSGEIESDRYTGVVDGWKCRHCGFFNRPSNGAGSPGTMNQGDGFSRVVDDDPVVDTGGCSFCGSPNSRKG